MLVLGLDPSLTNYGWAVHDTLAVGLDRCPSRGRFQTPAKMLFIDRYVYMREHLRAKVREVKPDKIGIEFPIFNDMWSEGMYGLFLYSCEALHIEKQDVVFWSPMQAKAHARESLDRPPKWKMGKMDMVDAAKADAGGKGRWNHNEADAYLVGRLGARFWSLQTGEITEEDLSKVEQKYFLEVKTWIRGKKAGKTQHRGVMYREDERFFLWSQKDTNNG